jgi:hypothetical protein
VSAPAPAPDERALIADLAGARFRDGADRGFWRKVSLDWPFVLVAVSAASRPGSPTEFLLKMDCTDYPAQAPTACPWDFETNGILDPNKRPKGDRAARVFRHDWEGGRALYAPWDRVGLNGHDEWPAKYGRSMWHSGRDLSFYLQNVHDLLNDDDYLGI